MEEILRRILRDNQDLTIDSEDVLTLLELGLYPISDETSPIKYSCVRKGVSDENIDTLLKDIYLDLKKYHEDRQITINLSENYLTNQSLIKINDFITNNDYLCKNLVKLKLNNNQLTEESFPTLKSLIEKCSHLIIDISINNISSRKFRDYFSLWEENTEKIIFRAF